MHALLPPANPIDQASRLRGLVDRHRADGRANGSGASVDPASPAGPAPCTVVVAGGKGGVGRSVLALNLGVLLAQSGRRTLLFDADPGPGQADLLAGATGYWNLEHAAAGARDVAEVVLAGPGGLDLVAGAHVLTDGTADTAHDEFRAQLAALESHYDVLLFDLDRGSRPAARRLLAAADLVLVVTTPEPTAVADAYATLKSLCGRERGPVLELLVNRAESEEQARAVVARVQETLRLYLRRSVEAVGWVPLDAAVPRSVLARSPFVLREPACPASQALHSLARSVHGFAASLPPRPSFFTRALAAPPSHFAH